MKNQTEQQFEDEFIEYLTHVGGTQQWTYAKHIKTTEDLWENFRDIISQNNQGVLDGRLSDTEFAQVKKVICDIKTPYEAGQFLFGINGTSEIEVDLDNGKHVFLKIFDKDCVGAGGTIYQVVNQIERKAVLSGKKDRRFDVTLLINGLPIIQIELKRSFHNANEALNQMEQYIAERQYSDIFSTLQILIAMTPVEIKYMANTPAKSFNKAFAFNWQNKDDATPIRDWHTFTDKVLSIPMAHEMATRYMILDGTKNKESIKVMRPYQVYATQEAIKQINKYNFQTGGQKLGYIWHTTGSGKTITSFKTAWLASRLPHVDKVIFLVDRIALTNQTVDAYKAYDPIEGFDGKSGVINNTANIMDLHKKLSKKSDKNIIVTSIQKMSRYVSSNYFKRTNENIVFIVDEAHRSTATAPGSSSEDNIGMLERIRKAIPSAAWIGYTGTPKFSETSKEETTKDIFGELIHAYTIKEAIADKNVLGFNVEFKQTIKPPENPTDDDIDDKIKASVYDDSPEHVRLVVKDIIENWDKRSNNRMYNALFTVHVGGNRASTPRVMEYFDEFERVNSTLEPNKRIKVAVSFSMDTSNGDNQLTTNENLERAINHYNKMFKTSFDMKTVKEYTDDVARRLNKTADDGNYLDLVIVVEQLLTGFDAPELNTLYVDRTLKGANLIQAYSRTNRMHKLISKPWGNVINYRWPEQNEYQMNKAFAIYSNRSSANEQLALDEYKDGNIGDGIIARPYEKVRDEAKQILKEISDLTTGFTNLPPSDKEKEKVCEKVSKYNQLLTELKQLTPTGDNKVVDDTVTVEEDGTDQDNPYTAETVDNGDAIVDDSIENNYYNELGITEQQEILLNTIIKDQLREFRAKKDDVDISSVTFEMVQINEVKIDYDYLVELIAKMADAVHDGKMEEAEHYVNEINLEIAKSEVQEEKDKIRRFVDKVLSREYTFKKYPAPRNVDAMNEAIDDCNNKSNIEVIVQFIRKWGLDGATSAQELTKMIERHRYKEEDLDKQKELTTIINNAKNDYQKIASPEVQDLKWLQYRIQLKNELYKLADQIKKNRF